MVLEITLILIQVMLMSNLNVIGPGYEGRSKNINASRCINFFPELGTADNKGVAALVGTFGTSYWVSASTTVRGMHVFNNLIYYVSGNALYSVDINRNIAGPLGDNLSTSKGRIIFSNNGMSPTGGDQLLFSDGVKTYCYDITGNTTTILEIPSSINCFIGGYFVADWGGGGRFRWSNLNDGSIWDDLNFATAESSPDDLISIFNNHGELWLFGEYTIEAWYQTGNSTSPFARVSGGVVDYGCAARYSVSQCNNTIYWLGNIRNNNQASLMGVFRANGYNAELVSTQPINYKFSQYNVINDAFAFTYSDQGHEFYVLTFPGENATWVYDTTTNLWHEWSTYSDDPYKINRHLSNHYCRFYGRHFVADYRNNNILEMSDSYYTDVNDPIVSTRITQHLYDNNSFENVFISKLQLDCETGKETAETFAGYLVNSSFPQSSTGLRFYINSVEIFDALITKNDLTPSAIAVLTMIACNTGLKNLPNNEIWGFFHNRVTTNANGTLSVALSGGQGAVVIQQHHANIKAVLSDENSTAPDVQVFSDDPAYSFTIAYDNPYGDIYTETVIKKTITPNVVLSWSDDGGYTWGNEHFAAVGKEGEYRKRVIWRRLGYSKNRTFRFSISAPIKKIINAQYIEVIR